MGVCLRQNTNKRNKIIKQSCDATMLIKKNLKFCTQLIKIQALREYFMLIPT